MIDISKYEGHTEGTWTLEEKEDDEGHQWFEVPAVSYTTKLSGDGSQQEFADANLIADAPLLLEEVRQLKKRIAEVGGILDSYRICDECGKYWDDHKFGGDCDLDREYEEESD